MTAAFDAQSLSRSYAYLSDCPERFFDTVVTLPIGDLRDRVAGVLAWRGALLDGRLPSEDTWPPPEIAAPARKTLDELGLVRFCRDEPELTDDVLHDVLETFARRGAQLRDAVMERLRELEALERARLDEEARVKRERAEAASRPKDWAGGKGGRGRPERGGKSADASPTPAALSEISEAVRARLQAQAEAEVRAAAPVADRELRAAWQERADAWRQISDVFGDLGQLLGRGGDLSRGVLRQSGWKDLLRLKALVEKLPQLQEVVRSLGRLQHSDSGPSVVDTVFVAVRRVEEELRQQRTPFVPAEVRGIERSGDIARMLPAEAAFLGHPQLRMLWHARRAERALMAYRVEGVEVERVQVERDAVEEQQRVRPRPERGPIVAVIDTSGSMSGTPELVAKALVLQAARVAHEERRRCFVYAYGGPGEVVEHELDLSVDGLGRLIAFLGLRFGGGTDIGALHRVVERLQEHDWAKADVVVATDGEWRAGGDLIGKVRAAGERGTRFHGLQIGQRGRTGLHDVCDPVHEFRDWVQAGGW